MRRLIAVLAALALVAVVVIGLAQAGEETGSSEKAPAFDLAEAKRSLAGALVRKGRLELSLDDDGAQAWLAVINDARLALGTRLEVTEDMDLSRLDPDDPDTAPYAVYWWLGVLEERLIDVLL